MLCVITSLYSNTDNTVNFHTDLIDYILFEDRDCGILATVFRGEPIASLRELNATQGNYRLTDGHMKLCAGLTRRSLRKAEKSQMAIRCLPTLWGLLRHLAKTGAQIYIDDKVAVPAAHIVSSRMQNTVFAFGTPLFELGSNNGELHFQLSESDTANTFDAFKEGVICEGTHLRVSLKDINKLSLPYNEFYNIANSAILVVQQFQMEIQRTRLLANWFTRMVRGISIAETAIEPSVIPGRLADIIFEAHSDCVMKVSLKGLLYGVSSTLFLRQLATASSQEEEVRELLTGCIPISGKLDTIFIDEVSKLLIGKPEAIESHFMEASCKYATQSHYMNEMRCLMAEYDFLPSELLSGITIWGLLVRITIKGDK